VSPVTRGFHRKRQQVDPSRVPPGQYVTGDFPVLSTGPTPHQALAGWTFSMLGAVEYEAQYVLAFCDGGYTTNMAVADLTGGRAWVAFDYGDRPLAPEHGGPARFLVPHLYLRFGATGP
jgi:DMSO/TMAO reductase YedYZ molybdopterin-dependent catalytic subunit